MSALTIFVPDELHSDTKALVGAFATALAEKLHAAEKKYGYSNKWAEPGWMDECRAKLIEHVHKGDPRDVAAYCAFLWFHDARCALEDQFIYDVTGKWPTKPAAHGLPPPDANDENPHVMSALNAGLVFDQEQENTGEGQHQHAGVSSAHADGRIDLERAGGRTAERTPSTRGARTDDEDAAVGAHACLRACDGQRHECAVRGELPGIDPAAVAALLPRIDAAIQRIVNGQGCMRIPADPEDPDLVLADCKRLLKHACGVAAADDRARFEAWAKSQGMDLEPDTHGWTFADAGTETSWIAWQAATSGVAPTDGGQP